MRGHYRVTPGFRVSGGWVMMSILGTAWLIYVVLAAAALLAYLAGAALVAAWRVHPLLGVLATVLLVITLVAL